MQPLWAILQPLWAILQPLWVILHPQGLHYVPQELHWCHFKHPRMPRSSKIIKNTKEYLGFCKVPKSCLGAFWVSFCHPWGFNWTQQVSQRNPKGAKRNSKELHLDAKYDKLLYFLDGMFQARLQSLPRCPPELQYELKSSQKSLQMFQICSPNLQHILKK